MTDAEARRSMTDAEARPWERDTLQRDKQLRDKARQTDDPATHTHVHSQAEQSAVAERLARPLDTSDDNVDKIRGK